MLITAEDATIEPVDTRVRNHADGPSAPPVIKCNGTRHYQQTDVDYDPAKKILWTVAKPLGVPCCNQNMVEEFHHSFQQLQANHGEVMHDGEWHPVHYSVIASRHPTAFNLGGDLAFFLTLIRERNRKALEHYAQLCVNIIYMRVMNFNAPLVTISLVQGDAMGGGLEFALSSNVIIAEQGSRMGLPEVIFNLFPGMGAYSLLSRRVGTRLAEKIMMSGNIYQAEELHRMGVIDILAARGEGEKAVNDFISKRGRRLNAIRSIYQCRHYVNPVSRDELMNIANLWVDAVLRLDDADMHIIARLVRSQQFEQGKRFQAAQGFRPRFVSTDMQASPPGSRT
ncbi:MAG: hypothetical protein RL404_47 [Pseudomonadota bacterium]|jgi:DSF synthase